MIIELDKHLAGWANYPTVRAEIATPADRAELAAYLRVHDRFIARGNGKSYGDAALAPRVLSTLALRRVLHFDAAEGIIDCEAGVLLSDLLPLIVPAGWFFHVTPGIKAITVGGAVASDVHGKNHPAKGCFSNWLLSFDLMNAAGEVLTCSRQENTALFWQTCGGMGWTGVILSARFQLMKIASTRMRQRTVRAPNLAALFQAFEENRHWPYAAGWVDCLAGGAAFGRGTALFAEHTEAGTPDDLPVALPKKNRNVPFFAPSWLLNPLSIRLHNHFFFSRNQPGERFVELDDYFYPLDRLANWNRLYGRRGFIQYQFCLPEARAFEGVGQILETIRSSGNAPFLSVLKRHGERPAEAVHSFPIRGWSLALDFPRTRTILDLTQKLDALVRQYGGKIYLTKDACSAPDLGGVNPAAFGEEKFWSLLKGRLLASV